MERAAIRRRPSLLYRAAMAVDTDLARHVLPENFSLPCLLRLHDSPAHGYDGRTYELTGAAKSACATRPAS